MTMAERQTAAKVPAADLRHREYWTPTQAARVLGRGKSFWRDAFDRGLIEGYTESANGSGRLYRYLSADSARALLRSRQRPVPTVPHGQDVMARFRASLRGGADHGDTLSSHRE